MRLIDLEELKQRLDEPGGYVDPYEIPGFLEHCEECQVIDAIPVSFIKEHIEYLHAYCKQWEEAGMHNLFTQRNLPIIEDTLNDIIKVWRDFNGQ